MARITVEDCLKTISNRFELVLLASKRTRQLVREGATALVPIDHDTTTVVALREIAANLINSSSFDENAGLKINTKQFMPIYQYAFTKVKGNDNTEENKKELERLAQLGPSGIGLIKNNARSVNRLLDEEEEEDEELDREDLEDSIDDDEGNEELEKEDGWDFDEEDDKLDERLVDQLESSEEEEQE